MKTIIHQSKSSPLFIILTDATEIFHYSKTVKRLQKEPQPQTNSKTINFFGKKWARSR